MAVLMVLGTVCSLIVLLGQVGKKRKTQGTIQSITTYPDMDMFE